MSWCACLSTLVALAAAAPAGLDLDSVLDRQAGGPWQQRILQWSPQEPSEAGSTALISGLEWLIWGPLLRELRDRGHTMELNPGPTEPGEVALRVPLRNGQERDYIVDAR